MNISKYLGFAAAAALGILFMAPPASAAPVTKTPVLDGRAAAAATGTVGIQSSWYSGTVAAGSTQTWMWNNNPLGTAYVVGFDPVGASTSALCQFQVTRQWNQQQYGGEREFWFTIKNVGAIACGTNILLTGLSNIAGSWSTGGMNPGQSGTWQWNNNPVGATYAVGTSPIGATNTATCQFEVTRTWYEQSYSGNRQFRFTIKNVGTIACSANILLGYKAANVTTFSTGSVAAGGTQTWNWNNANPLNRVYIVGFTPSGAAFNNPCKFEVVKQWYVQRVNPPNEREFWYQIKNVGSISCSATINVSGVDA